MHIRAFVEQQLQYRRRAGIARGNQQRRTPQRGASRIHVRPAREQQLDLRDVRHRPHQRRGAGRIRGVRIRSGREQQLDRVGARIERGRHQRGRAVRVGCIGA